MTWTSITQLINDNLGLSIGIGFSFLLLLIITIVLVKKRKKKEEEPTPYFFQDLEDELKKAEGLTPELKEKCRSFGVGYLSGFVALFPFLKDDTARDLTILAVQEKWSVLYIDNIRHNKELSLGLLAKAWSLFPDKDILPELVDLLADKDESVRMSAVDIIIAINDKSVLPYLIAALLQPEKYLPARVAEALVNFGALSAKLLADMLPSLSTNKDKICVLETLAQFTQDYPVTNLIACLKDEDETVRQKAAITLGDSIKPQAAEYLLSATYDDKWQVRSAAIKSLGQLLHLSALSRAEELLKDEAFGVRANAEETVKRLTAVSDGIGGE